MSGRVIPFRVPERAEAEANAHALRVLETPPSERTIRVRELRLEEPETLLALCGILKGLSETDPSRLRDEATSFYEFLAEPVREVGLFDEREYFLGELALLAGTACRLLFRREEAKRWFDRSESAFRQTVNAISDWARVSYQRLALRVEEREFDAVLELVPSLTKTFERMEMREDALKTRFLEGVSLMNMDRLERALEVFRGICADAQEIHSERLLAIACNNLVQIHGMMGQTEAALEEAQGTLRLLYRLDNKIGLAKLQWGVGTVLKTQGNLGAAREAFATAQSGFAALGMQSDVAALHLVLADLCLEIGEESVACRHVLDALPIIESEKMVPEGVAALTLLQESVRQRRINHSALRELHGYFDEVSGR